MIINETFQRDIDSKVNKCSDVVSIVAAFVFSLDQKSSTELRSILKTAHDALKSLYAIADDLSLCQPSQNTNDANQWVNAQYNTVRLKKEELSNYIDALERDLIDAQQYDTISKERFGPTHQGEPNEPSKPNEPTKSELMKVLNESLSEIKKLLSSIDAQLALSPNATDLYQHIILDFVKAMSLHKDALGMIDKNYSAHIGPKNISCFSDLRFVFNVTGSQIYVLKDKIIHYKQKSLLSDTTGFPSKNEFAMAHDYFLKAENQSKTKLRRYDINANPSGFSFLRFGKKLYSVSILDYLGRGAYGRVKCVYDENGNSYAVKIENTSATSGNIQKRIDEREVMQALRIDYLQGEMTRDSSGSTKMYTLIPLEKGKSLREWLMDKNTTLSLEQRNVIAAQCAEALNNLHKKRIIHGDIKPENIMVEIDSSDPLKINVAIIDFGNAKLLKHNEHHYTLPKARGTWEYMAPESAYASSSQQHLYCQASDIYSLGILFKMDLKLMKEFTNIISSMTDKNYSNRPSTEKVMSEMQSKLSKKSIAIVDAPIPSGYGSEAESSYYSLFKLSGSSYQGKLGSRSSRSIEIAPIHSASDFVYLNSITKFN